MYKRETIDRVLTMARETGRRLEAVPVDEIKIAISSGNRKIGRAMNVSLMPIFTCKNCNCCKWLCYDIKSCAQYPGTVIDARMRNTVLLRRDRDEFFARIDAAISRRRKNKFFRWHVAGDIIDGDYFARMVDIARRHGDFVFWTYTKVYGIVNAWIDENGPLPENFHVMFSEWRGMPMDNPHGLPEFRVVFKDEEKPAGYYCPGNCDVCKACNRGCLAGETVYCNEH